MEQSSQSFSEQRLRQQEIQARCFHPSGSWIEFPLDGVEKSAVTRFEEIVARYPERLAVKVGKEHATYAELNQAANRVAHVLLEQCGVGSEPVAILADQSPLTLVAMLGVIKAGKFFVPLDPSYPSERLALILADSQAAVWLSDRNNLPAAQMVASSTAVIAIESCGVYARASNPEIKIEADDPICIGYTSGSTGKPKGMLYPHRLFVQNYLRIYGNVMKICPEDRVAWLHQFGFAPSWFEITLSLLNGASLHGWDVRKHEFAQLGEWLLKESVTVANFTTTPFRQFIGTLTATNEFPNLRVVLVGGETVTKQDIAAYQRHLAKHTLFVNRMGSSESGCIRLFFVDKDSIISGSTVPAGYPVEGKQVTLISDDGQPAPIGEIGEIVVNSRYMIKEYWRNPELTRAKFIPNTSGEGGFDFHSGDLGRMQPDGCLEVLGRADFQIKIRGHRVELAEVEDTLNAHPAVKMAVVIPRTGTQGVQQLIAYVVPAMQPGPDDDELRRHLQSRLPQYMVPAVFALLESLPFSSTNKVDRLALAAMTDSAVASERPFVAPMTMLEMWLAQIWREVLQRDSIGVNDDFFALGGDSLIGMQIVSRLRAALDDYLFFSSLFYAPTIARFAAYLCNRYAEALTRYFGAELTQIHDIQRVERQHPPIVIDEGQIEELRKHIPNHRKSAPPTVRLQRKNPRALFVLAPGRSGTTLLRVMLAGHPQLFAPPELSLLNFSSLRERSSICAGGLSFWQEGVLQALMTIRGCPLADAQEEMRRHEANDLSTQAFYRHLQDLVAPRMLVDKTPHYAYNLATLRYAEVEFDQPLYVHLLRHPIATIRSFEKTRMEQVSMFQAPGQVPPRQRAEMMWLISHRNILEFLAAVPAHRQHRLRFEDLVRHPRPSMEAVCAFGGLAYHPDMLQPYKDGSQRMTDNIHPLTQMQGDPKFHEYGGIEPAVADRWREDIAEVAPSAPTWRLAGQLGYAPEPSVSRVESPERHSLHDVVTELESISDQEAHQRLMGATNKDRAS